MVVWVERIVTHCEEVIVCAGLGLPVFIAAIFDSQPGGRWSLLSLGPMSQKSNVKYMDFSAQAFENKEDGRNSRILEYDKEQSIALGYGRGIIGFVVCDCAIVEVEAGDTA